MTTDDIIKAISALGIGSGLGALVTSILTTASNKGKSRAEAADLLVGAAERVGKLNADLDSELRDLKYRMDKVQMAMLRYLGEEISREQLLDEMKELRR